MVGLWEIEKEREDKELSAGHFMQKPKMKKCRNKFIEEEKLFGNFRRGEKRKKMVEISL